MIETLNSTNSDTTPAADLAGQFAAEGYAGPVRVFSPAQCREFLKAIDRERKRPPLDWLKGYAAGSAAYYDIGAHPALLAILKTLLGDDILLWGASLLVRRPGAVHPWHTDIETADAAGGTATVWIGLENTHRDSSLLIIPGSHRFGASVQEIRHRRGRSRVEMTTDEIVQWAKEHDPRSGLAAHDTSDGEALFFDGRLWHGSRNNFSRTRTALLLQYVTPDVAIRMPDPRNRDWPFRWLSEPKPPCVLVSGRDGSGVNRIVGRPPAAGEAPLPRLPRRAYPLRLPLEPDARTGWKPYPQFKGATAGIQSFSCHASVLNQGCCPHPPHRHDDEEILMLLRGEVDLVLPESPAVNGGTRTRLQAGEFVFYPSQFPHTLETVSREPANYLMFRWRNSARPAESGAGLPFGRFQRIGASELPEVRRGFRRRGILDGPTRSLQKFHCHLSALAPGAGYEPHVDAYDVALVVLEGELETIDQRVQAHDVIFYPAGQPHGLKNSGTTTATYLVFEFHGLERAMGVASFFATRWLATISTKLVNAKYWKKRFKSVAKSFRKRWPW